MRAYSEDLRDRVISKYKTRNYKIADLSKLFNIWRHTISNWISRYNENGDYKSKQHIQTGRSTIFTDKQSILEFLISNPDSQGIDIRDAVAPRMPMSTFYDTLRRMKIIYKKKNQNILAK